MSIINGIGVFALDAFSVVFWAAVFAVTLMMCLTGINSAVKKGSDPNLESIPAAFAGIIFGGLIGAGASIWQLSAQSFITNMFGLECIFAVLCIAAYVITKKLNR